LLTYADVIEDAKVKKKMQTQNFGIHTSLVTIRHGKLISCVCDVSPNDKRQPSVLLDQLTWTAHPGN